MADDPYRAPESDLPEASTNQRAKLLVFLLSIFAAGLLLMLFIPFRVSQVAPVPAPLRTAAPPAVESTEQTSDTPAPPRTAKETNG